MTRRSRLAGVLALACLWACQAPGPRPPPAPGRPPLEATAAARENLARAEALYAAGDLEAARRVAEGIALEGLSEPDGARVLRLRAELSRALGDTGATLHWLALLRDRVTPAEAQAVQAQIDALLDPLEIDALTEIAEGLGIRVPAAEVWLRVAERGVDEARPDVTARALERLQGFPLRAPERARIEAVEAQLEELRGGMAAGAALPPPLAQAGDGAATNWVGGRLEGAIGVLLPLTGPLASVAEEILQGVLLAAGVFPSEPSEGPGGLRVLVRDTRGSPARAEAAIRDFAARGDVLAAIGPLLQDEVTAAADVAEAVGLPLLTLTRRESVARGRRQVFRLGLTREAEAVALAEHLSSLGIQSVAILYPRDDYGREFRERLWMILEARGVRIAGVAGYDPQATDFAAPIRSLIGYDMMTPEEVELIRKREKMIDRAKRLPPDQARELREKAQALLAPDGGPLPPIVDFEALFIPDAHEKVGLIVPQLAFHEIAGVRLFGPSAWHHPNLLSIAGRHIDGAFFSSGFDPAYPSPLVHEFGERFLATFGAPAGAFAAQGFDAAKLIQLQMLRGAQDPQMMRQRLIGLGLYPGVSGTMVSAADGNFRRRPFLIGVQRGATVSLE